MRRVVPHSARLYTRFDNNSFVSELLTDPQDLSYEGRSGMAPEGKDRSGSSKRRLQSVSTSEGVRTREVMAR